VDEIATKIKNSRLEAGLSQSELARKAGVSRSAVYRYEAGERVPDLDTVGKIAEALNIPFVEFVTGYTEASFRRMQKEELEGYEDLLELLDDPMWSMLAGFFELLNAEGRRKAVEYLDDLSLNPKYQADND